MGSIEEEFFPQRARKGRRPHCADAVRNNGSCFLLRKVGRSKVRHHMRTQDPLFADSEGERRARIAEGLEGLRAPSREEVTRDVLVRLHEITNAKPGGKVQGMPGVFVKR